MNSEEDIITNPVYKSKNNEWDENQLNGSIKSVKTLSYSVNVCEGEIEKLLLLSSFVKNYNLQGQIVSAYSLYEDGSPVWEYIFNGQPSELVLNCDCFNSKKELEERIIYHYDKQGNLTAKICTDKDGKQLWKIAFFYNEEGFLLMKEFFTDNNQQIHKYRDFQYDEKGHLLQMYDCPDTHSTSEMPDHFFDFKISYKYDENGEITERCETSPSGRKNITQFEYKYDNHGNWIQKKEIALPLNILTGIKERVIEYYHD